MEYLIKLDASLGVTASTDDDGNLILHFQGGGTSKALRALEVECFGARVDLTKNLTRNA